MLENINSASPLSEAMPDSASEPNPSTKALITKTPGSSKTSNQVLVDNSSKGRGKSYSDKNGNDVSKLSGKGRKTFAFWALVCVLFVLAIGNLILTFTILAVLRIGHGMESMEFLPEHKAVKLMGDIGLEYIYKRDGLIESFKDEPMHISSDNGSVIVNLQTRASRTDTKLLVNTTGVFFGGVNSIKMAAPSGDHLFSIPQSQINVNEPINNLVAKQISTKRITSPIDEDLTLRSESSAYLRGAEGTHMESKELMWSADQDIYLKSLNGSVVLSGKEGVFVDVRYLPIAVAVNKTDKHSLATGQFKVCVCMPQGKLFRIAVPNGQRISCSHVNMTVIQS